ncbi:MAG: hypothetical protein GX299_00010 [Epulopiscium sp.]|jgi:uncharacterized protein with FMN-binding domain|nr:hypothetical protein [Candidatus Epulonipiscium sp.]
MGGTKFMVIKLKELIKTAIFAVLGVIIIIGLVYFFLPKSEKTAMYEPGTYTAEVSLGGETAIVEVKVDSKKIKSVSLQETPETISVFYPLLEETAEDIAKQVVKTQSLEVDVSPQNAYTAQVFLEAINQGLQQATIK